MQRDLHALASTRFDLLVIGGGIYGACMARDAAYRGLSVALVERGDFGHATSHNSLKLIHGGLRYLQHLDIRRIRESVREQNFWLRAAPHIVRPLQFIMPTYGLGTRGPAALWSATRVHALLAWDRNRGVAVDSRLPAGGLMSRRALLQRIPGLDATNINAGAYWYDAQMLDPDRLIIEVVRDAVAHGAVAANYVEVTDFLRQQDNILGVQARDVLDDTQLEIQAQTSACAGGPWIHPLSRKALGRDTVETDPPLTKGMNLVTRPLGPEAAFGVRSARRSDAVVGSSRRMYFATPLPQCSVIGTSHFPYQGHPDDCVFSAADAAAFLEEFNAAYPRAALTPQDIYYRHGGLTPAYEDADGSGNEIKRSRQAEIIDHRREDGVDGLISVIGVKYTTARLVAERAIDLVFRKTGATPPPCSAAQHALPGAADDAPHPEFPTYGRFAAQLEALRPADGDDAEEAAFVARCSYALQTEMALRLEDLLLRRTETARRGRLTRALIARAGDLMAHALGWDMRRKSAEIENARRRLADHGARVRD